MVMKTSEKSFSIFLFLILVFSLESFSKEIISQDETRDITKTLFNSCLIRHNSTELSRYIVDGYGERYCTCLANSGTSELISLTDFQIAIANKDLRQIDTIAQSKLQPLLVKFDQICTKQTVQQLGGGKNIFKNNWTNASTAIGLAGQSRTDILSAYATTCWKQIRSKSQLSSLSDALVKDVCSCYSNRMVDSLSVKHLIEIIMGLEEAIKIRNSLESNNFGVCMNSLLFNTR